jgi:zinc and cadmium transporter
MFFLIRTFHFHQHGPADSYDDAHQDCEHDHSHAHHHTHGGPHELSWAGVATGLAVHTLIDGIALGAAVQADAADGAGVPIWGVGTFLAILFHKPLDAMSITSLMKASGWSNSARTAVNVGFSLMCPLGALLVVLGAQHLDTFQAKMLGTMLGFSAGVFLCISLGDLLPEVQFHRHDRFKLSAALLLGVAIAFGVQFIEPAHSHGTPGSNAEPNAGRMGVESTNGGGWAEYSPVKKPRVNLTRGSVNCTSISLSLTDDGESGNVFVGLGKLSQLRFDIDFARDEGELARRRLGIRLNVGYTRYFG